MDPLTAAGLASSVISFVDFTTKVIIRCETLYRSASGATAENLEIEHLAANIRQLAEETQSTQDDEILESLSSQCISVSDELIALLDSVKIKSDRRDWSSIHKALKSVWKQGDVNDLRQRLDRIQDQLHNRLVTHQQREIDHKIGQLIEENERLNVNRTRELEALRNQITVALQEIVSDVQREGQQTRAWSALHASSQKEKAYSTEQLLLNSLLFRLIDHRYQTISKEHAKTFSWIFDQDQKPDQELPSVNLVDWLRDDNEIYWISGKPGSGKSTLMKFLVGHEKTQQHLKAWSGGNRLVMASFYFWSAAKDTLQKSQTGLLRSIMYQILRQCPELIRVAFPDQWSQSITKATSLVEAPFNSAELLEAFENITASLENYKIRFCFFIDGLDEYDGRPADIVRLVESFKSSPNIKACVSSRPWNEFEASFGKDNPWKIYIHDLTREDIRFYVEDTLGRNGRFRELQESDEDCPDFVKSIVDAAQGVFLWVFLVVNSLLDGLTNADKISNLQERLLAIPKTLDEYFRKALLTIDKLYQPQMARTFAVTLEAYQSLPLMCYWFLDHENSNYALDLAAKPLDMRTTSARLKIMRTRLNAYCKGLLEVQFSTNQHLTGINSPSVLFNWNVDFLHRTVRDFLWTQEMQALLHTWLPSDSKVDLDICKATLAQIKICPRYLVYFDKSGPVARLARTFFHHVSKLESKANCEASQIVLLDSLATTIHDQERDVQSAVNILARPRSILSQSEKPLDSNLAILIPSVQIGLASYTEQTLKKHPNMLPKNSELLLNEALVRTEADESGEPNGTDILMLQTLLRNGADPNKPDCSSWISFLMYLDEIKLEKKSKQRASDQYQAVKLLLENGADPDARSADQQTSAEMLLKNMFSRSQYESLQEVIESRRPKAEKGNSHRRYKRYSGNRQVSSNETGKLRVVRSVFRELSPFRHRQKS